MLAALNPSLPSNKVLAALPHSLPSNKVLAALIPSLPSNKVLAALPPSVPSNKVLASLTPNLPSNKVLAALTPNLPSNKVLAALTPSLPSNYSFQRLTTLFTNFLEKLKGLKYAAQSFMNILSYFYRVYIRGEEVWRGGIDNISQFFHGEIYHIFYHNKNDKNNHGCFSFVYKLL